MSTASPALAVVAAITLLPLRCSAQGPKSVLTEGKLAATLEVRNLAVGGFTGQPSGRVWRIHPDGAWEVVDVFGSGPDKAAAEGKLSADQVRVLATDLAKFGVLDLPAREGQAPAGGGRRELTVIFGEKVSTLTLHLGAPLPEPRSAAEAGPVERFVGVLHAVKGAVDAKGGANQAPGR